MRTLILLGCVLWASGYAAAQTSPGPAVPAGPAADAGADAAGAGTATVEAIAAIVRGDYARAAELLQPQVANWARDMDPAAAFFLAALYENGLGVPQDEIRACALHVRTTGSSGLFASLGHSLATRAHGGPGAGLGPRLHEAGEHRLQSRLDPGELHAGLRALGRRRAVGSEAGNRGHGVLPRQAGRSGAGESDPWRHLPADCLHGAAKPRGISLATAFPRGGDVDAGERVAVEPAVVAVRGRRGRRHRRATHGR